MSTTGMKKGVELLENTSSRQHVLNGPEVYSQNFPVVSRSKDLYTTTPRMGTGPMMVNVSEHKLPLDDRSDEQYAWIPENTLSNSDASPPKYQAAPSRAPGSPSYLLPLLRFRSKKPTVESVLAFAGKLHEQKEDNESQQLLRGMFSGLMGDKAYRARLGANLVMTSTGGGVVSAAILCSGISSNAQFILMSGVFDEFFLHAVHIQWIPSGRYTGPVGFNSSPVTSVGNLPLGVASLQHGAVSYTSIGAMTSNYHFAFHSTGDPFSYAWTNIDPVHSVVTQPAVTTAPFQGWGMCSQAAYLTGAIQFISGAAPPALPVSVGLGSFAVSYDISFRMRI
jgi:hypothetical protein